MLLEWFLVLRVTTERNNSNVAEMEESDGKLSLNTEPFED